MECVAQQRMAPPLTPLAWVTLTIRWLFLAALPLAAGLVSPLTGDFALALAVWVAFSLVISALWALGWRPPWMGWATALIDVVLGLVLITQSGSLSSPIWSGLLVGALSAGLAYGMVQALIVTGVGLFGAVLMVLVESPAGLWALIPFGMYVGCVMLAGAVLGWLAEQAKGAALTVGQRQELDLEELRRRDRDRTRSIFLMAAELNATLNYERVLDMALDMSASALADATPEDDRLVSALLLYDENALRIASARRLTHSDTRTQLPGESGVVGRALATGDPHVSRHPGRDPELQRLAALQQCEVALCIPLTAGLEAYGALLFAHPREDYFNAERVELLQAIGHQAMIALQNARLYRDLEQEKERITDIQEEARKKLARDLHDGPTQSIAAIAMRVNFVRRLMERDVKSASDELYKVEDLARRTTKEIRHMLFTLRPLILESQGLVAALEQLAEKIRETHGQNVLVEAEPGAAEDLEIGKQGVVFYVAEEAINNARKHAEAEHIWVRLVARDDLFILEVQDDGVGFNVGAVDAHYEQRGSLGMVNMRERAELVNGLLRIDSAEGSGTCITVLVPLTEESAERLHRPGFSFQPA
jgi:signal transduction histidine kinase